MKKNLLFFIAGLIMSIGTMAQVVDLQKTYTISKKSKKGYLEHVVYDNDLGQYSLTYVTKANEKEFKFETYVFDRNFEFVELVEDQIEFEKAKGKYKWFKFKGAEYVVIGNFVEPNLIGTLVIRKKEITYKWDWYNGGYYKKVNVLEKVKLVGEAGDKLYYYGHTEDENNGDILVMCGIKENPKDGGDPFGHTKNFTFIRFNKDLDVVSKENFSFEHPQIPVFQRRVPTTSEDRDYDGLVAVFAPLGGMGYNKIAQPEKNLYTYVRCNHEGKILENIRFTSPETQWKIHEMVSENANSRVYLYGAAASNKDKYQNEMVGTKKYNTVQLMCIENGKIKYLTSTDLATIASKSKTPLGQKKTPEYEGKEFGIKNYATTSNGEFLVVGQNFNSGKKGIQYESVLGFHFDANGNFKSLYGINPMETNNLAKAYGAQQELIETADGAKMIYFILETKELAAWNSRPLFYPSVGSIDIASGTVSSFKNIGLMGKDQYYVDQKFPMLESGDFKEVVLFGSDKKGAEIWFTRLLLK